MTDNKKIDVNSSGVNFRAIAYGMLADIGGTIVFSFVFGLIAITFLSSSGNNVEQIIKRIEEFTKTTVFMITITFVGLLFTSFGGYVTARKAKRAEMKNAFFMGVSTAAFGVFFAITTAGASLSMADVSLQFLIIPFALFGGYVCLKDKAAKKKADQL